LQKLLGWILVGGLSGLLLAHPSLYSRKVAYIFWCLLIGLVWCTILVRQWKAGQRMVPPAKLVWVAVFLSISSIVSMPLSPHAGWKNLFFWAVPFLFLWVGWWLATGRPMLRVLRGVVLLGAGAASVYALLQYAQADFLPPGTLFDSRVVSFFENPNYFANYLAATLPLGLAAFLRASGWRARLGWGISIGLVYMGLLISGSRGAWWAALAGSLILLLGFGVQLYRGAVLLRPAWVAGLLVLLGCITVFFSGRTVVQGPFGPVSVGQRMLSSKNIVGAGVAGDATISHRYLIWQVTWEMIREKPLLGQGYGAYPNRFVEVRQSLQEQGQFPTEQWNTYFDALYAHNEYLHVWAEGGLFALLSFIGLIVLVLWGAVQAGFCARTERLDLWGALGLVVVMLVHSLVSYPVHLPLNGMLFWFTMGHLANRDFIH
jgi:O-antigen ligase